MRNKTIDLNAQAGSGLKQICDAIQGLKARKKQFEEGTGIKLDISHELEGIRSDLRDLIRLTEDTKNEGNNTNRPKKRDKKTV